MDSYRDIANQVVGYINRELSPHQHSFSIDEHDLRRLRRRMSSFHRWRFDQAVRAFKKESGKVTLDEQGQLIFADVEAVNQRLDKIVKLLK
jgi:hypothetical protein